MYTPTAKGYFSGCGGMEIGIMQAGVNVIQSLDLDVKATACMKANSHYFSHSILTTDIKDKTVLEQPKTDIIVGTYHVQNILPLQTYMVHALGMICFCIFLDTLPLSSLKCTLLKMCLA
jgi:DNA (cytosine-5)-methyltransferase 1